MYLFYNHRIIEPRILKPENSSGIYANHFGLQVFFKKKASHLEVLLEIEPTFSDCLDTIM